MNELLQQADETLTEVRVNQKAHQISYQHHYKRGLWFESAAKAVSALVGAGVFIVLVNQVGLSGHGGTATVQLGGWLYWVVLLLSLAAPALTALNFVRHDAKDAEDHLRMRNSYNAPKRQLEDFLRQYRQSDFMGGTSDAKRNEAEAKFREIREEIPTTDIGLMDEAVQKARQELLKDRSSAGIGK